MLLKKGTKRKQRCGGEYKETSMTCNEGSPECNCQLPKLLDRFLKGGVSYASEARQEIKSSLHMTQRMGLANADFTAAAAARLKNNKQHDCGGKVIDISRKCTQRTKCDS